MSLRLVHSLRGVTCSSGRPEEKTSSTGASGGGEQRDSVSQTMNNKSLERQKNSRGVNPTFLLLSFFVLFGIRGKGERGQARGCECGETLTIQHLSAAVHEFFMGQLCTDVNSCI